ncbi:MAG: putative maltokinase [bacterium]
MCGLILQSVPPIFFVSAKSLPDVMFPKEKPPPFPYAAALEPALPGFLQRQRWFGGKARRIKRALVIETIPFPGPVPTAFVLADILYEEGVSETYLLPVAFEPSAGGSEKPDTVVIARLESGLLCDALAEPAFLSGLFYAITEKRRFQGLRGSIRAVPAPALLRSHPRGSAIPEPVLSGAEQSNTSILFGRRWILKLYRRLAPGVNPELEIGRALTFRSSYAQTPPLAGFIEYSGGSGEPLTLAVLQGFVPSLGDAWSHALGVVSGFLDKSPSADHENIGPYLESAELMGRRTAELHLALQSLGKYPGFTGGTFTAGYRDSLHESIKTRAGQSLSLLRERAGLLPEDVRPAANALLESENAILDRLRKMLGVSAGSMLIRCHGDLHLGQMLYTGDDFFIIDFEGEPARPLAERRSKGSPLRDVAGMLRSFHYAAYTGLLRKAPASDFQAAAALETRSRSWLAEVARGYLRAYRGRAAGAAFLPDDSGEFCVLLDSFILEKALYELVYELNNRPDWVRVPMRGILDMIGREV